MSRMYSVLFMYNRINLDFNLRKIVDSIYKYNLRLDKHNKEEDKEDSDPL